jgi:hypothetical protein
MYISLITKEYVNGRVAITTDRIGGFRTGHGTTPDNFWRSLLKWAGQKTDKENVHVGFIKSTETYYENYVESIDGVTYQEINTEHLTTFGTDEFDVIYFISLPKEYDDGIPDLLEEYVKEGGGLIFESPDEEGEIELLSSIDSIVVSSTQRPNYDNAYWTTTGFNSELYAANFTSSFMVTIGQDSIPSDWSILLSNIETIVIPVEDEDVLNQFDYDNKDIVEFGMSFVVGMKDGLVTLNEGDNVLFSTSSSLSSSSSSTELETEWDFCDNILGYWKLNENNANSFLWDSSGDFSQIATLRANGSAVDTSTLSTTGKVNNAISFSSGALNNATIPSSTKLNFTDGVADTPFSIVFWVYPWSVLGTQVLITKDGVWEIGMSNSDLNVTLINGVNTRIRSSNAPIKNKQWNFVTVTYDGSDIRIYVKNVDVSTTQVDSGYTTMANVSSPIYFGSDSTASWFSGILDNVLIVDKVVNSIEREGMWNMGRGTEDCSAVLKYTSSSDSSSSSIDSSSSSSGENSESSSSSLGYSSSSSSSSLGYSIQRVAHQNQVAVIQKVLLQKVIPKVLVRKAIQKVAQVKCIQRAQVVRRNIRKVAQVKCIQRAQVVRRNTQKVVQVHH